MKMSEISVLEGVLENPKKKKPRKRRANPKKKTRRRRKVYATVTKSPRRPKTYRLNPAKDIVKTITDGGTAWIGSVATRALTGIIGERMPAMQEKPTSSLMEAGISLGLGIILENFKQPRLGRLAAIGGLTRALDGLASEQLSQLPGFRPPVATVSGYFEEDDIGQFITAEDVMELEGSMGNLSPEEEEMMDEGLEEEIL